MTSEAPQDVAALRRLAEAANRDADEWPTDDQLDVVTGSGWLFSRRERAYVAALSPDVVLGLLDQNDRLREALGRVVRHMEIMDQVRVTVQTWLDVIRPAEAIIAARDLLRGSGAEEAARNG